MGVSAALAASRDLLEGLDPQGAPLVRSRQGLARAIAQLAGSEAVTLRDGGGRLICIAGLFEHGPGLAEAWFVHGPAMRPHLKAALRVLAVALAAVDAPGLSVVAVTGSVAGAKIAARLGFEDVGPVETELGLRGGWARRF